MIQVFVDGDTVELKTEGAGGEIMFEHALLSAAILQTLAEVGNRTLSAITQAHMDTVRKILEETANGGVSIELSV